MTKAAETLHAAIARCPLVAILRGVRPDEVEAIGDAIVEAGFSIIEVPLNSPAPLASIALLAKRYGPDVVVGAGTVLTIADVAGVASAGGKLAVAPNANAAVIRAVVEQDMIALPGYFTPTEAFIALEAGAQGLKLFPAEGASPAVLKAQRAVLPKDVPILVVGGVQPDSMKVWADAGANGFGIASALYRPGDAPDIVGDRAARFVSALSPA